MDDVNKRWYNTTISYISLILLVAILSAAGYLITYPSSSTLSSIGVGIFSSFITSLIYGFAVYTLIKEPIREQHELKRLLEQVEARQAKGVNRIDEKYIFDQRFWSRILEETNNELVIIGHALSTWCEEPYSDAFSNNLSRMVSSGGTVQLVTVDPNGDSHKRLQRSMGQSYEGRIKRTRRFIKKNVLNKIDDDESKNIHLFEVSDIDLPYMLIKTDHRVIVSPYLRFTNSRSNMLIELKANSKFGTRYYNDASKIVDNASEVYLTK